MEVWIMFYIDYRAIIPVLKVLVFSNIVKNWFLKRRLDTNLCQALIDVKYTRDWQLGLKKNSQYWVVKPIIFTTQKMKFSVEDLFNKCE